MFHPKGLLCKKGPLRTVWVAAVCGMAALNREQIARTDIPSSVDKILLDIKSPYRILALLLLGIVRIYSKKVDFLYHECNALLRLSEPRQCTEPRTSTGRSMHKVLKHVKKAVCAGRAAGDQLVMDRVKRHVHSGRTTGVSDQILSSEGPHAKTATGVTTRPSLEVLQEAIRAPPDLLTITIPKRFELDSFDLEISEDNDEEEEDRHQLGHRDNLLEDEQHHAIHLFEFYERVTCSYPDVESACFIPVHDVLPSEMINAIVEANNIPSLSKEGNEPGTDHRNVDSACFTPVHDILAPEMMDILADINAPSDKSKKGEKPGREGNGDDNVSSACSIPLPESQNGQISENVVENATCSSLSAINHPTTEESEKGVLPGNSNPTPPVGFQEHDIEEQESLEPPRTQSHHEQSPSTPEPLKVATPEGVSGPSSPKFMVRTPAKNEKRRVTRKRRALYDNACIRQDERRVTRKRTWALYDEVIALPNEILRQAINNASDLVCKRRKAPHSYLDAWKEARINSLLDTFMDPLISYETSMHLSVSSATIPDIPERSCGESVKARRRLSYEVSESNNFCMVKSAGNSEREDISDEPRKEYLDELNNSIPTPVNCHTELGSESGHFLDNTCERNNGSFKEKDTQVRETEYHSVGLTIERLDETKNDSPCNEAFNVALDNLDEDVPLDKERNRDEGLLQSTRTRTIARLLCQQFLDQRCKKGNNSISLGQALDGRQRKTSARFFYETLILKSRGLIEVSQEGPYEDIVISSTPQLEEEFRK